MPERPVGVTDSAPAAGIADYRTRERTVSAVSVDEQYLVPQKRYVLATRYTFGHQSNVTPAADGATVYRWLLRNPVGSGRLIGVRAVEASSALTSSGLAVPSSPRFALERWTSTGTPAGGGRLPIGRLQMYSAAFVGDYSSADTSDFVVSTSTALWPFVAPRSGSIKRIWIDPKTTNTGITSGQVAVYSNSAGEPNTLLASSSAVSGQLGPGPFYGDLASALAVTSGTTYWIGFRMVGGQFNWRGDATGSYRETGGDVGLPATWNTATDSAGSHDLSLWADYDDELGPSAEVWGTAPTGLTNTKVADAYAFLPHSLLTTTISNAQSGPPNQMDYMVGGGPMGNSKDLLLTLAEGEAIAYRQADAGTASESIHRKMLVNVTVEEFVDP